MIAGTGAADHSAFMGAARAERVVALTLRVPLLHEKLELRLGERRPLFCRQNAIDERLNNLPQTLRPLLN
jgi:hypothetical protein